MPLLPRTCVTVSCDRCGDGWANLDAEPHFATAAEAASFAHKAGWLVTATRAVCLDCLSAEACALTGHRWGPWDAVGPFPRPDGTAWRGRVRTCETCSAGDWDPPARRHGLDQAAG